MVWCGVTYVSTIQHTRRYTHDILVQGRFCVHFAAADRAETAVEGLAGFCVGVGVGRHDRGVGVEGVLLILSILVSIY